MHKYYLEIEREEHLLFACEIRKVLESRGYSVTDNQIHKMARDNNLEKLFYPTSKGYKKVYDFQVIVGLLLENNLLGKIC